MLAKQGPMPALPHCAAGVPGQYVDGHEWQPQPEQLSSWVLHGHHSGLPSLSLSKNIGTRSKSTEQKGQEPFHKNISRKSTVWFAVLVTAQTGQENQCSATDGLRSLILSDSHLNL